MTHEEVTEAYEKYSHLVQRRCRRILRDPAAAEDAVQDTFFRLWRYGDSFREATSKVAWLYSVANNCCFDRLGARTFAPADLPPASPEEGLEGRLADQDAILRALAMFDDRVRKIIVLRYLDEMTHEEIGDAIGWSRRTVIKKLAEVESRLENMRAHLQRRSEGHV